MREVLFYLLIHPSSQIHSSLAPALFLLFAFFPFLKSKPLCHSSCSPPLLCCAHCQPGSQTRVVAAGLVLRKGFCPAANWCSSTVLSHLGPVRQQGHQCLCSAAGLLIFLLINANVAELWGSESFSDSAWVGKARNPPMGAKNSPI